MLASPTGVESTQFASTLSMSDLIVDSLRGVLHQTELRRLPYDARAISARRLARGATGHVVFIRVDRFHPDLMLRSQRIERFVMTCMKTQFDLDISQIYWRWGDEAQLP